MRDSKGDIDEDSTSGFFKNNSIFLKENSLKSLRKAQQELID